jgi:hypothetical protein
MDVADIMGQGNTVAERIITTIGMIIMIGTIGGNCIWIASIRRIHPASHRAAPVYQDSRRETNSVFRHSQKSKRLGPRCSLSSFKNGFRISFFFGFQPIAAAQRAT